MISAAIIANGFDGTTFLGFLAAGFLFRRGGLFINERIAAVVVALEIIRSGLATEVAINALVVHVIFALDIFGVFICNVSHKVSTENMDLIERAGKPNWATV